MYFPLPLLTLLATSTLTTALPSQAKGTKPPAFFLAGDSTTATQSPGGGGRSPFLLLPLSHSPLPLLLLDRFPFHLSQLD